MNNIEVVEAFVRAINFGDVDRISELMTQGHMFIDADGSERIGRDEMTSCWRRYFEMVPDFRIEVSDRFERDNMVILIGRASGTFAEHGEMKKENRWSVPSAWRVIVKSGKVAVWQLFANQHEMYEIVRRITAA